MFWALAWGLNVRLANGQRAQTYPVRALVPVLFGVTLLVIWEGLVRGLDVSPVILPAPSQVAHTISTSLPTLWIDFQQTIVKGAVRGFLIGVIAAFFIAILIDRSVFLTRGLLPLANYLAALPLIGIAPIFINWFGFDWHSKAAVVVVMVFFPVFINTVQGLREANRIQQDIMRTYAAGYIQTLLMLRLPAAMPFIFNGLKISTTLALIGAIVAEYFGSPIRGMGFRISTGVGSLSIDLVWAEITVAALAGSTFYGLFTLVEKRVIFWHPSQRVR